MISRMTRYLGNSAYAMPVKLPSAKRSAFFSDPSRLQRYTEPPRSVKNMRPFFKIQRQANALHEIVEDDRGIFAATGLRIHRRAI